MAIAKIAFRLMAAWIVLVKVVISSIILMAVGIAMVSWWLFVTGWFAGCVGLVLLSRLRRRRL